MSGWRRGRGSAPDSAVSPRESSLRFAGVPGVIRAARVHVPSRGVKHTHTTHDTQGRARSSSRQLGRVSVRQHQLLAHPVASQTPKRRRTPAARPAAAQQSGRNAGQRGPGSLWPRGTRPVATGLSGVTQAAATATAATAAVVVVGGGSGGGVLTVRPCSSRVSACTRLASLARWEVDTVQHACVVLCLPVTAEASAAHLYPQLPDPHLQHTAHMLAAPPGLTMLFSVKLVWWLASSNDARPSASAPARMSEGDKRTCSSSNDSR